MIVAKGLCVLLPARASSDRGDGIGKCFLSFTCGPLALVRRLLLTSRFTLPYQYVGESTSILRFDFITVRCIVVPAPPDQQRESNPTRMKWKAPGLLLWLPRVLTGTGQWVLVNVDLFHNVVHRRKHRSSRPPNQDRPGSGCSVAGLEARPSS